MPTSCVFQLDRVNTAYSSGEYISGRILLRTDKVKRVNAVYVTLEGEAKVQWSMSGKSETANYFGHQQYLYTRTNVFDSTEFRAGTHVYVLSLRIPPDCPSSCVGAYGYIAYNISLTIDKPWSFDENFRKPITVVQTLNLNFHPEYGLPVKDENTKYLCQWPCTSGPICTTLVLPFTGFVPLQRIPFIVEVDNQSPHYDVHSVEATLKQHFIFLAKKPLKRNYYTKNLAKSIIDERTLRLTKRLYECNVLVPDDTPRSTLNPHYIVFLHYTLQVRLKTGCFHYDTDLSLPIVIGTVPLREQNLIVTSQPTLRHRNQRNLSTLGEVNEENGNGDDDDDDEEVEEVDARQELNDDEPPSYDSCLPPSFSFATLGSQQTLEHSCSSLNKSTNSTQPQKSSLKNERQHININLPRFPGYNTFVTSTQAAASVNNSVESILTQNLYDSYGSLDSDHTGRSLDTFTSSCDEFLTEARNGVENSRASTAAAVTKTAESGF